MISVFAPGTLIAVAVCLLCWGGLTWRNYRDNRMIFCWACLMSTIAYAVAMFQYIVIFYVDKTPQPDNAMWALFIRMLFHCSTGIIFVFYYNKSFE